MHGKSGMSSSRRLPSRRHAVLALAVAVVAGFAAENAAAAPRISVPVTSAKAGAVVTVRGTGFAPSATGVIRVGGVTATRVRVSRGGALLARFRLPVVTPGVRRVVVAVRSARTGTQLAGAPLVVRPGLARVDHVVWVVMENKRYEQIIGSPNAPYVNGLAARFGNATAMRAETHPSLPNYIAMTSGVTRTDLGDSGPPAAHPLDIPSIFDQLNGDWRALQESMPGNCVLTNSGTYAVRHNPATYYPSVRAECATRNVPLADVPDLTAKFTFITPNLCSDTHDCPVATGDAWLAAFMPKVLASPQYRAGRTVVFLTWDESDGTPENHIATVVIAPTTKAIASDVPFNHFSMLRATEEMLGLPLLGEAAGATSMRTAFRL